MNWQSNPESGGLRRISTAGEYARGEGDAASTRAEWTDDALMNAVVARDALAFAVLYDRYADLVYSASMRVLMDSQLAEDATQDVFVRLWRRPESFVAERGRFMSWLLSVARNRAVDELRSRGRRMTRETMTIDPTTESFAVESEDETTDPLKSVQAGEERVLVRGALNSLPADQRLALELAYFSGLTQQEIAVVLRQPLGTVKTRIRLGMQKLRRTLDGKV
jgi:RNA polymerase sigma-70 factor, ECF subfamily